MKSKLFYIFITVLLLVGAFNLVKSGNFKIDLQNSTIIDTVGISR
jgi:hypothetical protein